MHVPVHCWFADKLVIGYSNILHWSKVLEEQHQQRLVSLCIACLPASVCTALDPMSDLRREAKHGRGSVVCCRLLVLVVRSCQLRMFCLAACIVVPWMEFWIVWFSLQVTDCCMGCALPTVTLQKHDGC
jgi:hypothetical protein